MTEEGTTKHTRWISHASVMVALAISIALAGCGDSVPPSSNLPVGPQRAVTHVVAPGETVYHIATEYRVSVTIPGAYRAVSIGTASSGVHRYTGERESRQFQWPVQQGVVSSGFGIRNGAMHSGVDIAAPVGTPVLAADNGVVIFSGTLHGYGNTVIIRHDDGYATVYGHNDRNLVSEGARVSRGQEISEIGRSGRTTGANLHFEVRRDNVAKDPLAYLPQPATSDGISFAAAGGS